MLTFDTHESVEGMAPCKKKPVVIHARRITEEFRVRTTTGNLGQYTSYVEGKPGALLIKGVNGELDICDAVTFEQTYDWGV